MIFDLKEEHNQQKLLLLLEIVTEHQYSKFQLLCKIYNRYPDQHENINKQKKKMHHLHVHNAIPTHSSHHV